MIRLVLALVFTAPVFGDGETHKLLPPEFQNYSSFGYSVAVAGNRAVIGSFWSTTTEVNSGTVFVFDTRTGEQLLELIPSGGHQASARFGYSVDIDGSLIVVGATHTQESGVQSGSAYVFDAFTGQQVVKLLPSDGWNYKQFGSAVSISKKTIVVGAHGDYSNGAQAGAAYVFDALSGEQLFKLLPEFGYNNDYFGRAVAISGTTVLVGAWGAFGGGRADLFDATTGVLIESIYSPNSSQQFGRSVSMDGSRFLIGAPHSGRGWAHLFQVGSPEPLMSKVGPLNSGRFGGSVAIDGNSLLVGAWFDNVNGSRSGAAYHLSASTGDIIEQLVPSDGAIDDYFGSAVDLDGDTFLAGAYGDDDQGNSAGSAYVFEHNSWQVSPNNGHWYQQIGPGTWADLEEQATALGGHLVTVNDQAENDWLRDTFAQVDPIWIGYTDQDTEGSFLWIDGDQASYEHWAPAEPDDFFPSADWVVLKPGLGHWFDEPGFETYHGVVELSSLDCNSDGNPDLAQIAANPSLDWNGDTVLDECSPPNYCTAVANSTGLPARASVHGSPILHDDDFILDTWDLPPNEVGYFLMSRSTDFIQGFGGSLGNLCLGSPLYRLSNTANGGQVLHSGSEGIVSFRLDVNLLPAGLNFHPGETWYFQLWYRNFNGAPTSNTSDGFAIMFR